MWCDDFDADLPKVVPGAMEALGDTAQVPLLTYSRPTGGKINCPSSWNGTGALFWTGPGHQPGPGWWTDAPVTGCTFGEAVRDEWVHGSAIVVNWRIAWRPPVRLMEQLMYDLRGWGDRLPDVRREEIRSHVLRSVEAAAGRLRAMLMALPEAGTGSCTEPPDGFDEGAWGGGH